MVELAYDRLLPNIFRAEAVAASTRAIARQVEAAMAAGGDMPGRTVEAVRRAERQGQLVFPPPRFLPHAEDRVIQGPAGDLSLRILRAEHARGVYLHIHGGGWITGAADLQDHALEQIVRHCRLSAVSVGYRLAPEHRYPAAADDCEAAACWLVENVEAEFGTSDILIGGESSGAHLSVVTLLRMRNKHGYTGFLGANLMCGIYDLGLTPSARSFGDRYRLISTRSLTGMVRAFLPGDARRDDPDISPLFANLSEMPPALISVGTWDPLLDDSLFMHSRWVAAGSEAQLAIYPGGLHGFTLLPSALAEAGLARAHSFMSEAVATPSRPPG